MMIGLLVSIIFPVSVPKQPTLSHYFIRLLAEKGLLLRNYTQASSLVRWEGVLRGCGQWAVEASY